MVHCLEVVCIVRGGHRRHGIEDVICNLLRFVDDSVVAARTNIIIRNFIVVLSQLLFCDVQKFTVTGRRCRRNTVRKI